MTDRQQSPTMIRNLDPIVWERIVREARLHDLSAGALASIIFGEWLAEHQCESSIAQLTVPSR